MKRILSSFQGKSKELIPLLQATQQKFGYLSKENMEIIAKFIKIPASKVYSAATFYSQFRFNPIGRNHIMACRGTACHVKGAPRILEEIKKQLGIDEDEVTPDGEFSLETVACIGACSLAPTMVINDETYGCLTPQRVAEIIAKYRNEKEDK